MKHLFTIVFLGLFAGLYAQPEIGRSPFSSANIAGGDEFREDIMYLFEDDNTDEVQGLDFINTGIDFTSSSPTPAEGSFCGFIDLTSSDYFTLPSSYTDSYPEDFTIMFWFYTETSSATLRLTQSGTPYSSGFNTRFNSTGNDMDVFTDASEVNATNFKVPSTDDWFHLAIMYESSTGHIHIIVDGQEETDGGLGEGDIGVTLTNTWHLFNAADGWVDDFRIFPEILSVSEIDDIHNNPGVPLNDI